MEVNSGSGLDKQILFSLERISEAFRVLLWEQSKNTGLSPIQIQFLIFIHSHHLSKCKVSYLAAEFNLTKATVSDSVKVLLNKGLLIKNVDVFDNRSFSLSLSLKGREIVDMTSGFTDVFNEALRSYSDHEKQNFYSMLHGVIKNLNHMGVISVQRNCASCRFYKNSDGNHYCSLLKTKLMGHELKIDCAEHENKK